MSVADQGQSVPDESPPHLLGRFPRSGGGEQAGGSGLGLAVCKGIVEAHGGRVRADSNEPGPGARLTITLPTAEHTETGPATPPAAAPARSGRPRTTGRARVLAVDDDPQTLRYLRETLHASGYAPTVTSDPQEALRLLHQQRPHLVLLDLNQPQTDGIKLMETIQQNTDVPVVFLSDHGHDQQLATALDTGAADYLTKPFSPVELAARIKAALRRHETPEQPQPYEHAGLTINYTQRQVTLAGSPIQLTPIEYQTLAELAANAGTVLTYQHLLRKIWDTHPDADKRPMRTAISSLRRKLQDNPKNPTHIHTKNRVGYHMPKGETQGRE